MAHFASSAAGLAGLAGALLGWQPDAFWRATPEELAGVLAALVGDAVEADAPPDDAAMARLRAMFPDA